MHPIEKKDEGLNMQISIAVEKTLNRAASVAALK